MNATEYRSALTEVLEAHSDDVASRLRTLIENIPSTAHSLELEIFAEQDGEGAFTIYAGLDGPDLHLLNKAIEEVAEIFEVVHTIDGLDPPVPLMCAFGLDFEVNDVLVDCAASWLNTVWQAIGSPKLPCPVSVVGHDDYGTITPLVLGS